MLLCSKSSNGFSFYPTNKTHKPPYMMDSGLAYFSEAIFYYFSVALLDKLYWSSPCSLITRNSSQSQTLSICLHMDVCIPYSDFSISNLLSLVSLSYAEQFFSTIVALYIFTLFNFLYSFISFISFINELLNLSIPLSVSAL